MKDTNIIPIASDHAGYDAKEHVKKVLEDLNYTPVDYGTHSSDSVDYPDYASEVSSLINMGEYDLGILICGSGQGMCMTANKFDNIRAALVWNTDIAELSKAHNNANILCLPGKFLSENELENIVKNWLGAEFEGGRHGRRVEKIHKANENQKQDNSQT